LVKATIDGVVRAPFGILDDLGRRAVHDGDTGIRGAEVDPNDFTHSGRAFLIVAMTAALGALGLLAAGVILHPAGGLATAVFLTTGGLLAVASLLPLTLAARRRRRLAFLAALRARWAQLARAGDPDDQIATLARAYAGLVGNDLRTRLGGTP
jgi:hypothetical protein